MQPTETDLEKLDEARREVTALYPAGEYLTANREKAIEYARVIFHAFPAISKELRSLREEVLELEAKCKMARDGNHANLMVLEEIKAEYSSLRAQNQALVEERDRACLDCHGTGIEYSGACHCGDLMDGHSPHDNHSAKEMTRRCESCIASLKSDLAAANALNAELREALEKALPHIARIGHFPGAYEEEESARNLAALALSRTPSAALAERDARIRREAHVEALRHLEERFDNADQRGRPEIRHITYLTLAESLGLMAYAAAKGEWITSPAAKPATAGEEG